MAENNVEALSFVPEMSTDSICVGENDTLCLTDHLEQMESEIDAKSPLTHAHPSYMTIAAANASFAATSHTHNGYAPTEHTHDYAASDHTHTGFAAAAHTHDGYADSSHTHTADDITGLPASVDAYSKTESDDRYAPASHTHSGYMTEADAEDAFAGVNHTHTPAAIGAAAASHNHSGYAETGHTHTAAEVGAAAAAHTHTAAAIGAASASHTHSEYAASNHGHSDYASSDHTHTADDVGALPASGGTVSGNLTVNGSYLYTAQIAPKDGGSYSIGSSSNRYYSTYLRVNPNVSSDRRCKRDIEAMDIDALAAFVDKLEVVNYNYNDDAADEAKRIGLIAQDVVAADPTIAQGCIEQDEKGFYSLRAADLVFPLIAAVQAQNKRIADLEEKLNAK